MFNSYQSRPSTNLFSAQSSPRGSLGSLAHANNNLNTTAALNPPSGTLMPAAGDAVLTLQQHQPQVMHQSMMRGGDVVPPNVAGHRYNQPPSRAGSNHTWQPVQSPTYRATHPPSLVTGNGVKDDSNVPTSNVFAHSMASLQHICATMHRALDRDEGFFEEMAAVESSVHRALQDTAVPPPTSQGSATGSSSNKAFPRLSASSAAVERDLHYTQGLIRTICGLSDELQRAETEHRALLVRYIFNQQAQRQLLSDLRVASRSLQVATRLEQQPLPHEMPGGVYDLPHAYAATAPPQLPCPTKMVDDVAERQECVRQRLIEELLLQRGNIDGGDATLMLRSPQTGRTRVAEMPRTPTPDAHHDVDMTDGRDTHPHPRSPSRLGRGPPLLLVSVPQEEDELDTWVGSPPPTQPTDRDSGRSSVVLVTVIATAARHSFFQLYERVACHVADFVHRLHALHQLTAAERTALLTRLSTLNPHDPSMDSFIHKKLTLETEAGVLAAWMSAAQQIQSVLADVKRTANHAVRCQAQVRRQLLEVLHQRLRGTTATTAVSARLLEGGEATERNDDALIAEGDGGDDDTLSGKGRPSSPPSRCDASTEINQPDRTATPPLPRASAVFREMLRTLDGDVTVDRGTGATVESVAAASAVSDQQTQATADDEEHPPRTSVSPPTSPSAPPPNFCEGGAVSRTSLRNNASDAAPLFLSEDVGEGQAPAPADNAEHDVVVPETQGEEQERASELQDMKISRPPRRRTRYGLGQSKGLFEGLSAFAWAVVQRAVSFEDDGDSVNFSDDAPRVRSERSSRSPSLPSKRHRGEG